MAPRSKAQSARPGYNKFGFKVTKAGSGVSAPKKSSSEQKTADAQAPKVEKTLKTAIGRPAKGLGNETLSALTITSTPPKLSASSEQYEEYVITTTYRVPRHVISEPPLVSVSVALPSRRVTPKIGGDVVSMSEDSRTVESSGLRSTMRTGTATGNKRSLQPAPVTTSSPSRSRRKLPRNRTPTPFHRGNPFHRMTPVRHTTPARRLTPPRRTPSTRPAARSRPPTLFKGTTPIRKAHWTKSISNMAKINHRSNLLLRHRTFTLPLKEPITIMRLELFWSILSDLIAHRKLFVGSMWEHWEYIGPCVQKINEKLEKEEWFGMEESCAAVRELQRQRLVMFTGGGKVMLTRNAV
ncbi:hypothetical protein N0V95_000502 [Ascochyta clinopodiicola]|nr:hypothetical protein N0V95_000502 [Ascochyta clinopodiicola]